MLRFATAAVAAPVRGAVRAASTVPSTAGATIPAGQKVVRYRDPANKPVDVSPITHFPPDYARSRVCRISKPPKNAMTSGRQATKSWVIQWDTQERWENPLMGWASTGDAMSNVKVKFDTPEEAMAFAEKNGWAFYVDEPPMREPRAKSYALNFDWKKRTRKNTK